MVIAVSNRIANLPTNTWNWTSNYLATSTTRWDTVTIVSNDATFASNRVIAASNSLVGVAYLGGTNAFTAPSNTFYGQIIMTNSIRFVNTNGSDSGLIVFPASSGYTNCGIRFGASGSMHPAGQYLGLTGSFLTYAGQYLYGGVYGPHYSAWGSDLILRLWSTTANRIVFYDGNGNVWATLTNSSRNVFLAPTTNELSFVGNASNLTNFPFTVNMYEGTTNAVGFTNKTLSIYAKTNYTSGSSTTYTNLFVGSGTTGSVGSVVGDAGKYLKADGTWATPSSGSGAGVYFSANMNNVDLALGSGAYVLGTFTNVVEDSQGSYNATGAYYKVTSAGRYVFTVFWEGNYVGDRPFVSLYKNGSILFQHHASAIVSTPYIGSSFTTIPYNCVSNDYFMVYFYNYVGSQSVIGNVTNTGFGGWKVD
jgi:hypothetical protein